MTLSVEVETARRERALVLPLVAVRTQTSDAAVTVLVIQDGRAQNRSVRLGMRTLEAAEVLDGLSDGDVVVMGGTTQPGSRVRAKPVDWQPGKPTAMNAGKQDAGSALTNAMGR
jgi:HlyD family secretion protein